MYKIFTSSVAENLVPSFCNVYCFITLTECVIIILIFHDIHSPKQASPCSYVRARVSEIGGGIVTVFAIDCGSVTKVPIHSVYSLPDDINIEEFPAAASLVRLKGDLF